MRDREIISTLAGVDKIKIRNSDRAIDLTTEVRCPGIGQDNIRNDHHNPFAERQKGTLLRNTELLNQRRGSGKEKCQAVTLHSERNFSIREPESERRNPTSTYGTEAQNKNMSSEEVDHSRWEEQHEDASDKAKSFIPFSPPLFPEVNVIVGEKSVEEGEEFETREFPPPPLLKCKPKETLILNVEERTDLEP
ncbi:hypothetical protein Csa_014694 [Cucumis sativus]|uniref:Uncharacterized protein n=1 Tax=Cucumis sativus TaxID=3659 RepID=A0A0A0KZJ6_CUCSA|nr:hypothetical protein Csa_014694 [Cucumis sativus]